MGVDAEVGSEHIWMRLWISIMAPVVGTYCGQEGRGGSTSRPEPCCHSYQPSPEACCQPPLQSLLPKPRSSSGKILERREGCLCPPSPLLYQRSSLCILGIAPPPRAASALQSQTAGGSRRPVCRASGAGLSDDLSITCQGQGRGRLGTGAHPQALLNRGVEAGHGCLKATLSRARRQLLP